MPSHKVRAPRVPNADGTEHDRHHRSLARGCARPAPGAQPRDAEQLRATAFADARVAAAARGSPGGSSSAVQSHIGCAGAVHGAAPCGKRQRRRHDQARGAHWRNACERSERDGERCARDCGKRSDAIPARAWSCGLAGRGPRLRALHGLSDRDPPGGLRSAPSNSGTIFARRR
jgi:hypothetical protein